VRPDFASRQRLIILVLVLAAIFSPSALDWMLSPNGPWYRPFMGWLIVIAVALVMQLKSLRRDDL